MQRWLAVAVLLAMVVVARPGRCHADGIRVTESGVSPDKKITVTVPGAYKAVIWQASGGGINELYDLAQDPEAKLNLAGSERGLLEIGWHGAGRTNADESLGDYVEGDWQSYGTRDWPSLKMAHEKLSVQGDLEYTDESPTRVRVQTRSVFTFWERYADWQMPVECVYTFYPTGMIVAQVRVRKTFREFVWSEEYGPHLFVAAPRDAPDANPLFSFSTPKVMEIGDGVVQPAEELVLATSPKVKTSLMITIPTSAMGLFDRHMRHDGRSVGWDRSGYGSDRIRMDPGYDSTWACMIQIGTAGSALVPHLPGAQQALPYAMSYRTPPRVAGALPVLDDPGDFDHDGYNESEGCSVLRGEGPLSLTIYRGQGAGFAPVFKVLGWRLPGPKAVVVDGEEVPAAAVVTNGTLILQVLGRLDGEAVRLEIGHPQKDAGLSQDEDGFTPLFNGRDLTGWRVHLDSNEQGLKLEDVCSAANRVMTCMHKVYGWVHTDKQYTNFILKLEWRWPEQGSTERPPNSGVFFRLDSSEFRCYEAGIEYGNTGDLWTLGRDCSTDPERSDEWRCRRSEDNEKPPGEWNQYVITADGGDITLEVNGKVVNTGTYAEVAPGSIGLQMEAGTVQFRNIRIKELQR